MVEASPQIQKYFEALQERCNIELEIAKKAREKGYDPTKQVEIQLAVNMAERVVGLISVIAPQIIGSGIVERIIELEEKYGKLDWRVAMIISKEVAQEKYCKFKDKKEAIEVGIKMGFAYGTVGVVSSPLEGLIGIEIKKRRDGNGEYFCLNYGGPIRNAGGTAAAVSVIIADYVRKSLGYAEYDPDEKEIKRCYTEITDYHERVTNLQYFPSKRESEFMVESLPVEISGDASEDKEVSNFKDLPRVPVNKIRSGFCLIHSSCLPLKAPKLWKQLSKWGHEMQMEQWDFLEKFIKIQKEEKSKGGGAKKEENKDENAPKIKPVYTYIADLVAGRPIIGHPLANGALRLRYGRGRFSGYSAQAINPASMHVMNDFIATGTQLKVERPGKGAAFTPCDTIEGPVVKLNDGSVMRLDTEEIALNVKKKVKEIIYLGDVLINYGDFFDRAHPLVPPGYCEEWWVQEFEKKIVDTFGALDPEKTAEYIQENTSIINNILKDPLHKKPNAKLAIKLAEKIGPYLHPYWTYYWKSITKDQLIMLVNWLKKSQIKNEDDNTIISIPLEESPKRVLELLGFPHEVNEEYVIIKEDSAEIIKEILLKEIDKKSKEIESSKFECPLDIINEISNIKQRDKCGVFIGARMGRPEKAKMRKLAGSPHTLFPVGNEGGRLRCFQSALEAGKITAEFPIFRCEKCGIDTVLSRCEICDAETTKLNHCYSCGNTEKEECQHGKTSVYLKQSIDIKRIFRNTLKKLGMNTYPDLIKGVRGTSNREHIPEHIAKGILRSKYDVSVNKDGTIRYDCSELPVTHFKPKEIGTSVDKLIELGYEYDIRGKKLENENQILEIKPQDLIIPCCPDAIEEGSDEIMFRTTKFIDDMLINLYGLEPYYNLNSKKDLVGQLVIGLAPHTSAGTICRIIGFSKTQAFLSHYLMHAAMRRDCDGDESCFFLLLDAFINFSRKYLPNSRGSTMDAPLVLTSILNPGEVDDMAFNVDTVWKYPLEFYEAALQYKMPWDVDIDIFQKRLGKPEQYEGLGFTHDTEDLNVGVLCSSYKTLPSMQDKMRAQMNIAEKIRAVDEHDVARLVIEKHFIRDIKGNLRKFSQQQFRCVACNEKYRRPPLRGVCTECGGKIVFTISEGSIVKYLEPSLSLSRNYKLPAFLNQSLELLKRRIEGVFGREKERQEGLGKWFG